MEFEAGILPKTRAEGRAAKAKHFFTGKPCPKGHVTLRYTSTGGCDACLGENNRAFYQAGTRGDLPTRACRKCGTPHNKTQCPSCSNLTKAKLYEANKLLVRTFKVNNPCTDCGLFYSWVVMEFDHRDGRESRYELIAQRVHCSREVLLAELAKCDLVCANCHRVRTYERDVLEGRRNLEGVDPDSPGKKSGLPTQAHSPSRTELGADLDPNCLT